MRALLIVALLIAAASGRADAYPQFQLVRDSTCSSCHLSPAGGGLLNENGLNTAEVMAQYGMSGEFMYGKLRLPSWLALGGDVRTQGGYMRTPQDYLIAFPMQADLYANASHEGFSLQTTFGFRPAQFGNEAATRVYAREHYVMYQTAPGERDGLFARVGRFMPVFGLRFVEHPLYVRRFGGTPLFAETYAASASYVHEEIETHVTGFINDPLIDAVQPANGVAVYGELRLGERTLIGGGGMFTKTDWEQKYRGTLTAKHYLPSPGLLLQTEFQVINPHVGPYGFTQIAAVLMASYHPKDWLMIDVALGHYDENLRVHNVDRDCIDVNVHWFATSHVEALLVMRYEMIGRTEGGPSSGWAMAQLHYRL